MPAARLLIASLCCVLGCGGRATVPRATAPIAAQPAPDAVGAMPLPEDAPEIEPVPPELRAAPVVPYYEDQYARTDLSSLGDFTLDVPYDFDDGDLKLTIYGAGMTQLVVVLDEDTYTRPDVSASMTEACRSDANLYDVKFTDNDYGPFEMAVFRIGDEIRLAVRAGVRPDAWKVTRVIRVGPRAEIRIVHPDPH